MMSDAHMPDKFTDQISLHALDALDEASTGEMRLHLDDCPDCQRELDAARATVALLALDSPVATPAPETKDRLLERVRESSISRERESVSTALPALIDLTSLDWQPDEEHLGASYFMLRRDETTGTFITLVKMDPNCVFPDHDHPGGEDCRVLQGAFRDGRGEYHAGDYIYYEPGSKHRELQALATGCICLVVAHGGVELRA